METKEIILNLKDCNKFFKDNLTTSEIESISKSIGCSVSTIIKYINGNIPDNYIGDITSSKIVIFGVELINKKAENLISELNIITKGKTIPCLK